MNSSFPASHLAIDFSHQAEKPPLTSLGAAELGRRIARREVTSSQVTEAFIARIVVVNPSINAVVWPMFDEARRQAKAADLAIQAGDATGPLFGVPMTIKECNFVAGTPSTVGLTHRKDWRSEEDGPLIARLRRAGLVFLGKTNLSQLMLWHASDNPIYGKTNNPWNLSRGPGGSSGGEGAIIAAGGSPLGLGGDLGGSIRLPAHFCGVSGILPTRQRLTRRGSFANLRGLETIQGQQGPLARRVEDLEALLQTLASHSEIECEPDVVPGAIGPSAEVDVSSLRIGYWSDDKYFPASPAIVRAVNESAEILRGKGAEVVEFDPPDGKAAMAMYYAVLGADGAADAWRLAKGSELDPRLKRMLRLGSMPNWLRPLIGAFLRATGRELEAHLLASAVSRSADGFWQLSHEVAKFRDQFIARMQAEKIDAILCPPHALPAMPHEAAIDLIPAASYSFLMNLLALPSGTTPITVVRSDEESGRTPSKDRVLKAAAQVDVGSAGLPVGVQVAGRYWREDVVLAVMKALENAVTNPQDTPA